ncbi:hypothetical protein AU468_12400 [Alkalispirochaeta sphaeroplastigenens]|uniref:Uncharacterized protein n=1 Tax=Alkalispirochaeta sphaeroplastigenens TaxID=1187066 RepID=A0A2S4JGH7_9SPIO|nr:DUF6675 family protein [Alkalispirochaeta sphaeroplastigenens]POQ98658.1 hypothetical protein AU468_12400 [Alkalispirochaeta sphaeroplastigenens]
MKQNILIVAAFAALVNVALPVASQAAANRASTPSGTTDLEATVATLAPGLSREELAELLDQGSLIFHSEDEPITFRYLPRSSISDQVQRSFGHFEPNVVNEVLFLLPRPQENSRGAPYASDQELLLDLYNTFRAVSKLSGVEYESSRAGGMRVLFDNVYAIESVRNRDPLPDPVVTRVPRESSFLLHLEDSNFGRSFFEASFYGGDDAVSMGMTNLRSLTFFVPVVRAERVRFQMLALPLEDHLLLYGAVGLEAGGFLRRMVHLPGSFRRRIVALTDWFTQQVYNGNNPGQIHPGQGNGE